MKDLLLLLPFIVQALLMFVDEFYYHHKRGLPKWEVIGHPLDTLSVLSPFLITYFFQAKDLYINIYLVLCMISCLFIAKDEFVHKDLCAKGEMFLHALLFMIHPMVFFCLFKIWSSPTLTFFSNKITYKDIILTQCVFIFIFCLYQISYWGIYIEYKDKQ